VFIVIIYNRFVASSKCGPHDFDPPPSQKTVPTCLNSNRRIGSLLLEIGLGVVGPVSGKNTFKH